MGLFKKSEEEAIHKAGGVMEIKGGSATEPKSEDVAKLVKEIAEGKTEGFFFVLSKQDGGSSGIARFNRYSKLQGLVAVLRAIRLPFKEVVTAALISEDDD